MQLGSNGWNEKIPSEPRMCPYQSRPELNRLTGWATESWQRMQLVRSTCTKPASYFAGTIWNFASVLGAYTFQPFEAVRQTSPVIERNVVCDNSSETSFGSSKSG